MTVGNISERQIDLRSDSNSGYADLKEFFDSVDVLAENDWKSITVAAGFKALGISELNEKDGILALASGAITSISTTANAALDGGLMATIVGTLPTAANASVSTDPLGSIINRVEIRDTSSKDPILVPSGTEMGALIFGLVHTDGVAGDAFAADNLTLSLAFVNSSGAVVVMDSYAGAVEVSAAYGYAKRYSPKVRVASAGPGRQEEIGGIEVAEAQYLVTTEFTVGQVLTLATGAGSGGSPGASTDTYQPSDVTAITLPSDFDTNVSCEVELNGIKQVKGTSVSYASGTTLTLDTLVLDIGDVLTVKVPR